MTNNEDLVNKKESLANAHDNNPFTFKGSLSRGGLLLTMGGIFISFLIFIVFASLIAYLTQDEYTYKPIISILGLIYALFTTVILIIAYMKRLHDIINNKRKAIFYILAFDIAQLAISFIPGLKYLVPLSGIILLSALLFIPGKK